MTRTYDIDDNIAQRLSDASHRSIDLMHQRLVEVEAERDKAMKLAEEATATARELLDAAKPDQAAEWRRAAERNLNKLRDAEAKLDEEREAAHNVIERLTDELHKAVLERDEAEAEIERLRDAEAKKGETP